MQFLKKLFGSKSVIGGLDAGTYSIKLAQVVKTPNGFKLVRYAEAPTPALTIKDGQILDSSLLGQTIKSMAESRRIVIDRVVGAVSGQSVVIRPINMTAMNQRELQNAIKFESERYLPYSVSEAQIKGTPLRRGVDGDEKNMEVLLVAAPNEMVSNTQEVIKMAGMDPLAIDLEPFALVRAAQAQPDRPIIGRDDRSYQPWCKFIEHQHFQGRNSSP